MRTWLDAQIDVKGRTAGDVRTTCPRCSHLRKKRLYPCLHADLDQGLWHCHHCGWSGSLKTGEYARTATVARSYRKPDYVRHSLPLSSQALEFFTKRGITEAVLLRNQIASGKSYFPQTESEHPSILFPYRKRGETANIKHRSFDKLFRLEGGCERILYGLDDIGEQLLWVEGEVDKLSLEVAGITSCVSVPDGAPPPHSKNYESKFDFLDAVELARATTHLIAVDNDAPGLRLRDELVRRLGPEKCRIVDWPEGCNDANDVLVKFGVDTILNCVKDARELPIVGAHQVIDYMDDIQRIYREGIPLGVSTGWKNVDRLYKVRPGDVTIVTGAPNSGKSEWLDALCINVALLHDWRFAVFSPEQGSIAEHVAKLVEKKSGLPFNVGPNERIGPSGLDTALTWINDKFWFIQPDAPTLGELLKIGAALVLRKGVRGLILDPWNEIEHSRPRDMSETEYIGDSLRRIRIFGKSHQVHVWVVAHPHKLLKDPKTGQYPVAGPYEIAGSAHFHNKPDVCVSVWRSRSQAFTPEVEIHIQKVRSKYVGRLGLAVLNWNRINGRYSDVVKKDDE